MDIIRLLPDNIANQIAAGEVIQRPASAVKELLENAVDAGATEIKLLIQDAGKALIQVVDNGKGMSETDARMAFERHATSKIQKIEDLFQIRTMGFRGEALASIAAVSQVELKSKRQEDELATYLEIENSSVIKQEPCAAQNGTSIAMKNLFFNVPARRNFLKSNAAEMRHIVDEFIHVAMSFPQIFFSLSSNGQEMFHLESGSLKQRIVQILGNNINSKLVTVEDSTDYLTIKGFVGKPDAAKKTRGDQFFFVNNRYIKSAYLNHAVTNAFDQLLPKESFPLYVLFIELDPAEVDINVHPTKQEIKFEDEKIIYAFVSAAIKHALAQFSIAPTLDFNLHADIQQLDAMSQPISSEQMEKTKSSSIYQGFTKSNQAFLIGSRQEKNELEHWKDFFEPETSNIGDFPFTNDNSSKGNIDADQLSGSYMAYQLEQTVESPHNKILAGASFVQLFNTYILVPMTEGFVIVHQQLAHERILYERFGKQIHANTIASQKLLFPSALQLSPPDAVLLSELLPELNNLGYTIQTIAPQQYEIQGIPADIMEGNETHIIELLLEQFKHFNVSVKFSKREKIVRCLARQQAIKAGKRLSQEEMSNIANALFECQIPNLTPNGDSPTYVSFKEEYLDSLFGKK